MMGHQSKKQYTNKKTNKTLRAIYQILKLTLFSAVIISISSFTPILSGILLFILEKLPQSNHTSNIHQLYTKQPTAYVVLGGGLTKSEAKADAPQNHNIILNRYSLSRVQFAKQQYQNKPLPIVLSGVESPWMKQWLIQQGITQVISENASMNTCENARFTAKRLKLQHVYLITDSYHMTRARRQFAINGIATTALPAPLLIEKGWAKPRENLHHSRRAVYELLAYLRDIFYPQDDCRYAHQVSMEELMSPRYSFVKTF